MCKIAAIAAFAAIAFLALPLGAQDDKKDAEKRKDSTIPPLKVQRRPGQRAEPVATEDGKEKNHETLEKQGWVYLFDSRIPRDPKSSEPMGLWRLRNANDPKRNLWSLVEEGGERILRNAVGKDQHGTDLISKQKFFDFDLHVELRVPESSNSGVYLRGRYEIQIDSSSADRSQKPGAGSIGAIYGVREPLLNASRGPGQWQVLEATIRGNRIVNVRLNGETIHATVEIPEGKRKGTGSELTSADGESDDADMPGPIFLQGDHGSVDFKNLRIRPRAAQIRRLGPERERLIELKKAEGRAEGDEKKVK